MPMHSLPFVPADSERKLARGLESGADALILDLEDMGHGPAVRHLFAMRGHCNSAELG
jgi:hypothetical protein